jgi:hypothetical protein
MTTKTMGLTPRAKRADARAFQYARLKELEEKEIKTVAQGRVIVKSMQFLWAQLNAPDCYDPVTAEEDETLRIDAENFKKSIRGD